MFILNFEHKTVGGREQIIFENLTLIVLYNIYIKYSHCICTQCYTYMCLKY